MKSSVYIGTSLDGFIARNDGNIDWLTQFANKDVFDAYEKFIGKIDAIVIGRGTFEKVLTFPSWPYKKKVFVLCASIKEIPGSLSKKVTLLTMQPKDVWQYLSNLGQTGIYIDGGKVIQEFLRADLVDELIISKVPVLIGSGISLFGYLDRDLAFKHIRTETFSNGLVRSYYERDRT